ncbi:MAG: polyprenyl synthetase family protein [Leptospirales bacterium]|jgi:octaprenyl-diphosphate synthase
MPGPISRAVLVNRFNTKLGRIIGGPELSILGKVKQFVIKSGGKRIRPITHYYFTGILEYGGREWEDIGAIGELIHAASLLHDDVVDDSNMRRGKPSVNALHGNKTAILSGDYLLAAGLDHLRTLERSVDLLGVFTRVIRMLSVGELLQMEWEREFKLAPKIYDRIILGKTGSLFGAMSESAYVLATPPGRAVDPEEARRYREFGERMGRLFQVRDDYLDYFGDARSNGKELYQDFRRGLITHPIIVLRSLVDSRKRKILAGLWKDDELRAASAGLDRFLSIAQSSQIQTRLAREIEEEVHGLMHFVRNHPESAYREKILEHLTTLLVPQIV